MNAMKWRRLWVGCAGISGAVAMSLAAMAAHALSGNAQHLAERAVEYQILHALALLALAALPRERRCINVAGALFVAGTVFFCGSLYGTALWNWPATFAAPLGGTCLIAGWVALAVSAWKA